MPSFQNTEMPPLKVLFFCCNIWYPIQRVTRDFVSNWLNCMSHRQDLHVDCKSNCLFFMHWTLLGQLPLQSQLPSGQQKASSEASNLKLQIKVTDSCDFIEWPAVILCRFLKPLCYSWGNQEKVLCLLVLWIQTKALSIPQILQCK